MRRRSKYGNIRKECNQMRIHRSKDEANCCNEIFLEYHSQIEKREVIIEHESPFNLDVNGVHIAKYVADWVVGFRNRKDKVIEFKGYPTPVWKLKEKLFRALYPEIELEVRTKK